jgi:hypothetical protein
MTPPATADQRREFLDKVALGLFNTEGKDQAYCDIWRAFLAETNPDNGEDESKFADALRRANEAVVSLLQNPPRPPESAPQPPPKPTPIQTQKTTPLRGRDLVDALFKAQPELALPKREWKVVVNEMALGEQTDIAIDAISDVNEPPHVFYRAGSLVTIVYNEYGAPTIVSVDAYALRAILERCAMFVKLGAKAHERPVAPPMDVVMNVLATLPRWHTFPPLAGIAECPLTTDGTTTPHRGKGYDPDTMLYYAPAPDLVLPTIPETPSPADILAATRVLLGVFEEFPFADDASRTNAIAAVLTIVLRPSITGPVPLALIDKPQAGTGATLLAEVVALIGTGRTGGVLNVPEDDAAWRKLITSALSAGRTVAIIDNVETKLHAPALAVALTANLWEDRILGKNEMVTLPHRMVWLATGNNIQLGGDLPRRCYWIRMDAHVARPWQREGFRHPDLLEWGKHSRGQILAAVLTITHAWKLAGKPKPDATVPVMGGFGDWRNTIGGILEVAGITGFLANIEAMYEMSDTDGPQWDAFIEKIYQIWKGRPVTVADIQLHMHHEGDALNVAYGSDRLVDALPDALSDAWLGKKNFARVLGRALSRMNGRVFTNELGLVKGKQDHSVATWQVLHKKI